jgi:glycosyltransferase involved in cell wall biosynthesis
LRAALDSTLSQTEGNFELLIIDDHSTDGSWKIIEEYAKRDRRIKAYRNETNKGLVKSLNSLIPKTRGTYIARMDADDVNLPERFAKQVELLSSSKELVAVGGQEYIIDTKGTIIAEKYFPTDSKLMYDTLMNVMVIQPPLLLARGGIMRRLRYDNKIFKNDDISMHFKLLQYGSFGTVDEIIFKYRHVPASLTHKNPKRVYFLALLVRLNAIWRYGYRPAIANILAVVPETVLVMLLPRTWILRIFEVVRLTHVHVRRVWQFALAGGADSLIR